MEEVGLTQLQPIGSFNDEKARMIAVTQKVFSVMDSFNMCAFVWGSSFQMYGPKDMVEMINAATGWDINLEELLQIGERRVNMMRAFNAREGFTRKNDMLSKKFFKPLQGVGPAVGEQFTYEQFESVKDSYYRHMGWESNTGNPDKDKMKALGLGWVEI